MRAFIAGSLMLILGGCATTDGISGASDSSAYKQAGFNAYERHYLFEPSAVQMAKGNPDAITDEHFLAFSENVKEALRRRMNRARIARMFSGTIQVLTAATAAGLGAVSANIETITALAGTSAVIPQLQELFDAKGRAEYYEQGANMIEEAQGRYFDAVARGQATPTNGLFSVAAVALFEQTVASLKVVEKGLISRLPTVEEMQKATGTYSDLVFVPNAVTVKVGQNMQVLVTGTATISGIVVADQSVATASLNGRVITVQGVAANTTSLVATDVNGKPFQAVITVNP